MKAESNIMPQHKFKVEKRGELADIIFYENIQTAEKEGQEIFEYDNYIMTVPYREDIETDITENYEYWIDFATEKENEVPPETESEKIIRLEKENEGLKQTLADLTEVVLLGGM